ncbi:hypothetical protein [Hyphomonas sp.]|uniref:hypothetical protein n=1 Tax=Hyphomonas sp. TaxID=87 RepID=UPI003918C7FF
MDDFERLLGPRPQLTLDIEQGFLTAIWVAGRRPDIAIRDYDLGACDPDPALDAFGARYVPINWYLPPWRLGLALAPGELFPF